MFLATYKWEMVIISVIIEENLVMTLDFNSALLSFSFENVVLYMVGTDN